MLLKIFFGLIIILCILMVFPSISYLWTDNSTGFLKQMSGITTYNGSVAMSDMETSYWGLFPVLLLVVGVGGYIWLIARDR